MIRILRLLRPKPSETFVDYGCGDARWCIEAARRYGCRAVGVELDTGRAMSARKAVKAAGLSDKVTIHNADATKISVNADVGVVYLWPETLKELKPALTRLNRFASYQHKVPGLAMEKAGDVYLWKRPAVVRRAERPRIARRPRAAVWGGQYYSRPVCNSSNCRMCNAIRRQLGF